MVLIVGSFGYENSKYENECMLFQTVVVLTYLHLTEKSHWETFVAYLQR
jgi:hypothetical protein